MINELYDFEYMEEAEALETCESCAGTGAIDVGDCEEGIWEACPECEGQGIIQRDLETFVPARDAYTAND